MSALEGWVQRHLTKLLLGMLAGGFAILLAELLLTAHVDGIQLVAVVASVTGLILTVAAMFVSGRAGITVAALLLVLSVTGLVGAYEHFEERSGEEAAVPAYVASTPANQVINLRAQDDDDRPARGEEGPEGAPPPLAPLSLSGLSLMAAIVTVGASKPRA